MVGKVSSPYRYSNNGGACHRSLLCCQFQVLIGILTIAHDNSVVLPGQAFQVLIGILTILYPPHKTQPMLGFKSL